MKQLLILFLAIVGMAIGLASCQKNGSSDPSIVGTWKVVSSTDPVQFPVDNVTWTFGASTMTISFNGLYESRAYRIDGRALVVTNGNESIYMTIVDLTSSTLVLSVDGATIKFQRELK